MDGALNGKTANNEMRKVQWAVEKERFANAIASHATRIVAPQASEHHRGPWPCNERAYERTPAPWGGLGLAEGGPGAPAWRVPLSGPRDPGSYTPASIGPGPSSSDQVEPPAVLFSSSWCGSAGLPGPELPPQLLQHQAYLG